MKEKRRKSRRNIGELEEESGRSISKKRIRTRKEGKGKEWWDAECRKTKIEVKNAYRKWRNTRGKKESIYEEEELLENYAKRKKREELKD